jgi:tellurite resistance protein TerC
LVIKTAFHLTYRVARRIVVAVIGATICLLGVVMLVTPGPALVMIPVGLAVLSIEFAWARLWLKKLRASISNQNNKFRAGRAEAHRKRAGP